MDYWDRHFATGSPGFQVPADEDDIEEFRSEKSVKTGKSPEEIRKFSVDESLSDMEKSCLLLSTGQSVQKLCVIESLPELLQQHQMETLCKIIPKICDMIPSSSAEVQITASRVLGDLVQEELIPIHIYTSSCLNTVLRQLENKDPVISRAWLGTLLASIAILPKDELKRKIMTLAVAKGQLSQSVASRKASCCILKEIAGRFDPMWLKREVLPLTTQLCQDVDSTVRELMCKQLVTVATALGHEVAEGSILPELVELLNDEENFVRVTALQVLTDLLTLWSEQCQKSLVIPLVQGFCKAANKSRDWQQLEGVSQLLGRICYEMKGVMTEEQFEWFLKLYCDLSTRAYPAPEPSSHHISSTTNLVTVDIQVECKQQCAFNFPAMLLLVGKDSYKSKLSSSLRALASDSSPRVRRTIACGFHEVVSTLEDRATLVAGIYQSLLKDSSEEVLNGLVTHIPIALKSFAKAFNLAPETRHPGLADFIAPLLAFDQLASTFRQWRLHCELVKSYKCLVTCMTSDQIHSKFLPVLLKHITGEVVLPIKRAAAYCLCVFIRFNRRQDQRTEMIAWIIDECAKGHSCRRRLLFLDMCTDLIDLFSRSFFKTHFFDAVLQLAQDPVINIRLRLCQLFPALKSLLKLPADRVLLQSLEMTVRKLLAQDRDPDVAQSIRTAVTEMDRIEVAMETLTRKSYFESDLSDQQKEIEERALVIAEEKERIKSDRTLLSISKKTASKGSKACASPRESRKSSLTGALIPAISHSPSVAHKTTKEKSSKTSPATKILSAPSSTVDVRSAPNSPAHSPAHTHKIKHTRKQLSGPSGSEKVTKSPPTSDKNTLRNTSASASSSTGSTEGQNAAKVGKSKETVNSLSSTSSKGPSKKKQYGLEYSKKRT